MLCRCRIEVKYAVCDAASVVAGAGGILGAVRAAETLHGDTAKHPRRPFVFDAGVLFAGPVQAINVCT